MKLAYPPDRPKLVPALRAVLSARAQMACTEVATHGPLADAFMLRKRVKECRGLLRLLRGGWDDAVAWDARLREAAARLAPARDAEVRLVTFDRLTAQRRAPIEFDGLRDSLLDAIDAAGTADPDAMADFAETLSEFAEAASRLRVPGKTAPLVWHNLGRSWTQCQRAYTKAAHADDDAVIFHDWRKKLKRHWYQARFFKPIDRKMMAGHIGWVDLLGEILGLHNDLDVLLVFLRETRAGDPALSRLEPDLLRKRRAHAESALKLARALHKIPDPAEDWAALWTEWRRAVPARRTAPITAE